MQDKCNAVFVHKVHYLFGKRGGTHRMFQIRPDKKETENKTIRFPVELVQEIEEAIQGKNVTFSGFVLQACRYALDNMEEE